MLFVPHITGSKTPLQEIKVEGLPVNVRLVQGPLGHTLVY